MRKRREGFTLIELLVVIGILAVLLAIVLVAINPSRQFKQANDTKRTSDVNAILNAVTQYGADHKGDLAALGIPTAPAAALALGNVDTDGSVTTDAGALCAAIVPLYIASLPGDPTLSTGTLPAEVATCTDTVWSTGYTVIQNAAGRVTVSATGEMTPAVPISVTR